MIEFDMPATGGRARSADLRGPLLLWFYPKDDTPG